MGCRGGGLLGLWLFVVVVEVKFMVVVNFFFDWATEWALKYHGLTGPGGVGSGP